MLNDFAYHLIASILEIFMWDGELVGQDNLQEGPGVIVANHMGAIGPVGLCCSLPMRLYPWVEGATVDKVAGPENVRQDFLEKTLHVKAPLSIWISKAICKVSIPLLLSIGCVPVPVSRPAQEELFATSMRLLKQGKFLLVVPEDIDVAPDPITGIGPFKRGFLRLGELFAQETGQRLKFYPVTVHETGLVRVQKPIEYNPLNEARLERTRMVTILEKTIKTTYLEISENETLQPILIKRNPS